MNLIARELTFWAPVEIYQVKKKKKKTADLFALPPPTCNASNPSNARHVKQAMKTRRGACVQYCLSKKKNMQTNQGAKFVLIEPRRGASNFTLKGRAEPRKVEH